MAHAFNIDFVKQKVKHLYQAKNADPCIQVYEGRLNSSDTSLNPVDQWSGLSEAQMIERLEYVADNYHGTFTFFMRTKSTEAHANAQRVVVDVGEAAMTKSHAVVGGQNVQKLVQDAIENFKKDLKIAELEKQLKEQSIEKVPWGFYATSAFNHFILGQKVTAPINGANLQAQAQITNGADDALASEAVHASFEQLYRALGEENIHKLAYLTNDQNLVAQFIQYLNSIPNPS